MVPNRWTPIINFSRCSIYVVKLLLDILMYIDFKHPQEYE